MKRSESCWSAAEVAAGIAYRLFTAKPDDPATAEKKTQTEISTASSAAPSPARPGAR